MSRLLALSTFGVLVGTVHVGSRSFPVEDSTTPRFARSVWSRVMLLASNRSIQDMCFRGRDTTVSSAAAYDRLMFATYAT